jgi:hypothetical protein
MSKLGIIGYSTWNVGDEIQSIAIQRNVPKVDFYADRETLHEYRSDHGGQDKFIISGWYMNNPDHWPPSADLDPLIISFHMSHKFGAMKKMTQAHVLEWYRKLGRPIGCRDKHTMKWLQSKGVDAYFSGCATLTLKNPYTEDQRTNEIILADALFNIWPRSYGRHYAEKLVPAEYQKDIRHITHRRVKEPISQEERIKSAEAILDQYAKAKLVITSRIHTALPCLGMGTPVIFLDVGYTLSGRRNRFEGLIDNMTCYGNEHFPYSKVNLIQMGLRAFRVDRLSSKPRPLDIDWDNPPANPVDIQPIADGIRKTIADYLVE